MRKVALITGSSQGIGREIAKCFAKEYDVVLHGFSHKEELFALREELLLEGCDVLAFAGDIGDEKFVKSMFNEIKMRFGRLDVCVNNAGIALVKLLRDTKTDEWNKVINTNLTSVFLCSKEAIELMLPRKEGSIINISSIWGNVGASCEVAYSASKGGVNSFTKALAKEMAPSNISVNAIACGVIDTKMNSNLSEEEKNELAEEIPAGRFASPKEVALLAYSMAKQSGYLTGQVITFDGGFT
ncbi:MAG: SDR family NAD(P)-dependent oxidoreductase [Lachnospiraceae bacterium]|nr:SDR family NAD(P)-dependent oxidoreductase [Lachnospiraceae bacterium]